MPHFKEKWYLDDNLLEQFKNKFLDDIRVNPTEAVSYHPDDIRRVKENDWFVSRYLLHTDKDFDKSFLMLKESLKYRKNMDINTVRKKDLPLDYFKARAVILYNKDKRDHPLVVVRCKMHIKVEETRRLQQQYMMYWVERGVRKADWGVVSILFDCTDSGVSNMDVDMIRFIFDLFKKYYPWGLGFFFVYNMPWYMSAFWKMIKQWIPAKYVEKICFVDSKSILEHIDEDQLPLCIGGTSTKLYEPKEGMVDGDESE